MDWDIDYQAQLRNISKQLSGQLNRYNITSLTENFDLNKKDLYDYICHKLPKYQLEKRVGNINVPISQLSSGEKKTSTNGFNI